MAVESRLVIRTPKHRYLYFPLPKLSTEEMNGWRSLSLTHSVGRLFPIFSPHAPSSVVFLQDDEDVSPSASWSPTPSVDNLFRPLATHNTENPGRGFLAPEPVD